MGHDSRICSRRTGCFTNSEDLAHVLHGHCSNLEGHTWHRHVGLINGKASFARQRPPKLVAAVLGAMRRQMVEGGELSEIKSVVAGPVCEEPELGFDEYEEEEVYESGDPIGKLRDALMAKGVLDEAAFKAMGKEIRGEVRECMKWADASPPPGLEELYHDVYVEPWGPYTGTSEPQMIEDSRVDGEDG